MRKVSEYKQHAAECRQMAAKIRDQDQKKQLEEMAEAWTMLATERARQLAKQNERLVDPESSIQPK
ncbi:MAG: hypothetical protein WA851_27225 [Xanthobacteraceae bacterium]